MKRLVIYHANCPDGFTAAWAAWKKFGDEDTEYVPASYGDAPPDVSGKDVLIVDFSYPRGVLIELNAKANSLRVYDHHEPKAKELAGLPFCEFDNDRSGAGMAWDALHTDSRPWLISYVEDRDLWRFKLTASKEVNAAIGATPRRDFRVFEADTIGQGLDRMRQRGESVLAAQNQYVESVLEQARMLRVEGQDVPIVNCSLVHMSEIVGALAERSPGGWAIGWIQLASGQFKYSLRSRNNGPDVFEVAKKYGGGGHRAAASFTTAQPLTGA